MGLGDKYSPGYAQGDPSCAPQQVVIETQVPVAVPVQVPCNCGGGSSYPCQCPKFNSVGAMKVDGSAVTQPVSGDVAIDGTVDVNIVGGGGSGGTSAVDDAPFTAAVDSGTPIMGFVTSDTVNSGDVGVIGMDAARNIKVSIEVDNAGIGGGVQYAAGAVEATPTGTVAMMETAGNVLEPLQGTVVGGLLVNLGTNNDVIVTGTVTADTELPAAAALADNTANPTTTSVGSLGLVWDGATWDRQSGNAADGTLVNLGTNNDVFVSNTVTVTGSVTTDSEFPAAAALTDNFANPTTTNVAGMNMVWDGATWDRAPGNITDGTLVNLGANNDVIVTGTVTADTELPAQAVLADNAANPTTTSVGTFPSWFDGSTWDRAPGNSVDGALVNLGANNDVVVSNTVTVTGSVTTDSEFPAAAALTDNFANPTTTNVAAMGMVFDGSTWDRQLGNSTDGTLVNLGANNDVTVTGAVTANAGTDLNTSALSLEATQQSVLTSLQIIDDWDESDRAKVNPIVGNAGVTGNTGTVDAGTQRVTLATNVALPAGTNNIGDVDVLTVPADPFGVNADAASATGSISAKLRFIAATGIPITGTPTVQGAAAHDAALSGNPVRIGAAGRDTLPTAVGDNETVDLSASKFGSSWSESPPTTNATSNGTAITTATDTVLVAAPAAGNHLVIHRIMASNSSSTVTKVAWRDGVAGSLRKESVLPQYGLVAYDLKGCWHLTSATALYMNTSAAGNIYWDVEYQTVTD